MSNVISTEIAMQMLAKMVTMDVSEEYFAGFWDVLNANCGQSVALKYDQTSQKWVASFDD